MRRAFICIALLLASLFMTACGTAVPDVRGMTVVQAEEALASAGFEVGQVTYDEDAEGALGAVMSQNPEAGKSADEGSLVALTVAGPAPVTTPDLSGLDREQAQIALSTVGLSLGEVSESYDATASAGVITSQTPAGGADAPRDSEVTVVVSKGPEPVAVPDVKGKTETDARKLLESVGFSVEVERRSDSASEGTVLSQDPADGTAQPGSTVVVTVSSGADLVQVPNVVGTFWGDSGGVGTLKAAGFVPLSRLTIPGTSPYFGENNEVVYQDPSAGTLAARGSEVRLIAAWSGMGAANWEDEW